MTAIGTRLMKIKIGSTEYTVELTKAVVTSRAADASLQTFAAAAIGGARVYMFEFTAPQDPSIATSIWSKVFNSPGTTVAIVLNPYGVTTATATTPFQSFNAIITEPDGDFIGGSANSTVNMRQMFSCAWELDAKPTLVTTGSF